MENLKVNIEKTLDFTSQKTISNFSNEISRNIEALYNKTGKGSDFLGWVTLPSTISEQEITEIEKIATGYKGKIEVLVVIGIGGSYLGSKAVIESLSDSFQMLQSKRNNPVVIFAGQNISEDYHAELLNVLKNKEYAVVVISKSGTTTEPAIGFRLLKQDIEKRWGKDGAKERIVAVTDAKKGALKLLADKEGYQTFEIPDDIGGRYSVLTPVGLLPIAIAGFNIRELISGAKAMQESTGMNIPFETNPAAMYAATRNALYKVGYKTEILVNYNPKLHYIAEWWKQLYGESEGKQNKGIFPASVDFTSDLHSMGQYIQEGVRTLFETVVSIKEPNQTLLIPSDEENLDKLNFLAGKPLDEVNKMAELGTMLAHVDGGVPNIHIEIPKLNEYYIGSLLYFFEIGCGISGYLLGVNPFDQPGVEAYKNNMFALLGKPGFEEATKKIQQRLK